jgi:hypothetical protein
MLVAVHLACVHFHAVSVEGHRAVLVDLDHYRPARPATRRASKRPHGSAGYIYATKNAGLRLRVAQPSSGGMGPL